MTEDKERRSGIPLLNDQNWSYWDSAIYGELLARGNLWGIVDGREADPGLPDNPTDAQQRASQRFEERKAKALGILLTSIGPEMHSYLPRHPTDPVAVCKLLEERCQPKTLTSFYALRTKLNQMSLTEGEDPLNWLHSRKELYDRLTEIGHKVEDATQAMETLALLPKSYEVFRQSLMILLGAQGLSLSQLSDHLRTHLAVSTNSSKIISADESAQFTYGNSSRGNGFRGRGRGAFRGNGGRQKQNNSRAGNFSNNNVRKCFGCGSIKHLKRNCPKTHGQSSLSEQHCSNFAASNNDLDHYLFFTSNQKSAQNNKFVLDSGATTHMTPFYGLLSDVSPLKRHETVGLADGKIVNATAIGTLNVQTSISGKQTVCSFQKCLYVPALTTTLISVGLIDSNGYNICFGKGHVEIQLLSGKVVGKGTKVNNSYILDCHPIKEAKVSSLSFQASECFNTGKNEDQRESGGYEEEKTSKTIGRNVVCNVQKEHASEIGKLSTNTPMKPEARETQLCEAKIPLTESEFDLWHRHFGHLNEQSLRQVVMGKSVDGTKCKFESLSPCQPCVEGKMTRFPYPKQSQTAVSNVLDLVHSDICGPIENPTIAGNKYFITFIDGFSKFAWSFLLKSKDQAFETFKNWLVLVQKQVGRELKVLRTDNGLEYLSKEFQDFLESKGIRHELSAPYSPPQNGVAERLNRTLLDKTRAMMFDSNLPVRFWGEALRTASYLYNRSPTSTLPDKTPYEAWCGKRPNASHLRVFGCVCYALVPKQHRKKMQKRSEKCIFLGYAVCSKAYRLWSLDRKTVLVRRSVVFHEGIHISEGETKRSQPVVVSEGAAYPSQKQSEFRSLVLSDYEDSVDEIEGTNNHEIISDPYDSGQPRRTGRLNAGVPPNFYGRVARNTEENEEPRNLSEAVKMLNADKWLEAATKEFNSLQDYKVWQLVDRPKDRKVVGGRWVFRVKKDEHGNIQRYKARYVAKGYTQVFGQDYFETFSPVVRWESVRLLISLAAQNGMQLHQMDIDTAFLNGILKETIYLEQPEGFVKPGDENKVCKLFKSIYGVKQSPKAWNWALHEYLLKIDFVPTKADSCLYVGKVNGELVFITVYVDDLIIAAKGNNIIQATKGLIAKGFKVKDLGRLHYFLGVRVRQSEHGFWLGQDKFAGEIVKNFGMESSKPIDTPMEAGIQILKFCEDDEVIDSKIYQSAIGSLLYLASTTRPDLSFAVHKLAQFASQPAQRHWSLVKRVLRYVNATKCLGLFYECSDKASIVAFSDADYAADPNDRKSTSGYVVMHGGTAVSWKSKKQSLIAQSTAEAEYVALYFGVQECVWYRQLLTDLKERQVNATTIYEDNQAAIKISNNPVSHPKTKHIAVKYHFTREAQENGLVKVQYIPTKAMIADIFTKPLPRPQFTEIRMKLGLQLSPQNGQ